MYGVGANGNLARIGADIVGQHPGAASTTQQSVGNDGPLNNNAFAHIMNNRDSFTSGYESSKANIIVIK